MPKSITALLIAFLSVLLISATNAPVKKPSAKVKIDTSKIVVKNFNANAVKKYSSEKDFNYDGEAVGQPTFWEIFWRWLWNSISEIFNKVPYAGPFLKYLFLGLSVALLIFAILKSLGIDAVQLLKGDAKKISIPFSESQENIHEINFDEEIEKAASQHNFRLAVRLLYLKSLKQLSDKDLIKWQDNKTNSTYIYELTDASQRQTFGLLTRQFEYVWYGDFPIDKNTFANINSLFQNFAKYLK